MFYWSINFILDKFFPNSNPSEIIFKNETIPRKFTEYNFFQKLPKNLKCSDVGVPDVFCACNPLRELNLDNPMLLLAGELALSQLNAKLPKTCLKLKVGRVNGGAIIENLGLSKTTYIIGIVTDPGKMQIEANIDYFKDIKTFNNISQIQRMNKINKIDVKCLKGDKEFELFCICGD